MKLPGHAISRVKKNRPPPAVVTTSDMSWLSWRVSLSFSLFLPFCAWRSGTLTLWHINIGEMVFHLRFHKELYLAVDGSDGNKAVQIRWHTALKLVCVHLKVSMTKYFNKFAGTHEHLRSRVARSFRSAELKAAWVRRNGRGRGEPRQHNSLCWNHPKNCDSLQHFLEVFFLFLYGEGAWFHALFGKSR